MNLDERLVALTQTVELLAAFHKDNERRMERFEKAMEEFGREMKTLARRNTRLEGFVTQIAEGTARLLHTVEAHEQRIASLENGQSRH
jgi:chromosome segregation ATPase